MIDINNFDVCQICGLGGRHFRLRERLVGRQGKLAVLVDPLLALLGLLRVSRPGRGAKRAR